MIRLFLILANLVTFTLIGSLTESTSAQGTPTTSEDVPANLAPPAGSTLIFELAARGVQIYTCAAKPDDATAFVWTFTAPEAELFNQPGEVVGTHFAGPTWQGLDGSAVIGMVRERADSPDAGSIPWLLLDAKDHQGSGVFSTIAQIQRLDTIGGVAPTEGCDKDHAGDEVREPYQATYAFYYPATPDTATPVS